MKDHIHYMREAIALSRKNMLTTAGGPFGAVIVKNNEIIGRGSNKVTSSNDPTAHSEIVAIREACQHLGHFSLAGCEIYSSCEPCPMCLSAIYWARIEKIYYANTQKDAADINFDDAYLYKQMRLSKDDRKIPSVQLLGEEAIFVFEEWKKKKDKILY